MKGFYLAASSELGLSINNSGDLGSVSPIWAPNTNHEHVFLRLGGIRNGAKAMFQTNEVFQTPLLPQGNQSAYLQLLACEHPHSLKLYIFIFCASTTTGLSCILPSTSWKLAKAISAFLNFKTGEIIWSPEDPKC